MTLRSHAPFRADHVGSFLRPAYLLEAREKKAKGEITPAQLREVEDRAITEIVKFQADVGLQSITDGEFRRTYFHIDFLEQLGGVKTDIPVTIRKPDGTEELAPPVIRVIDKVRHAKNIQLADFEYLKAQVQALGLKAITPKVTIPSPTMLHFRGGRAGISKEAYPELDPVFYDDVAKAYGDELQSLADAGCTYVQMDDTNMAYLCDEKMREAARQLDIHGLARVRIESVEQGRSGYHRAGRELPDQTVHAVLIGNFSDSHVAHALQSRLMTQLPAGVPISIRREPGPVLAERVEVGPLVSRAEAELLIRGLRAIRVDIATDQPRLTPYRLE